MSPAITRKTLGLLKTGFPSLPATLIQFSAAVSRMYYSNWWKDWSINKLQVNYL